ncbi:hypothetical protein GWI33_013488, partial [Rhynchophorus ferrugineus]
EKGPINRTIALVRTQQKVSASRPEEQKKHNDATEYVAPSVFRVRTDLPMVQWSPHNN